jgi:CDP-glucose 4,6-dehydratase
VIGGGDWSEDRLIPDAVRAWSAGRTLVVRRPEAIRPWQHVLEPICGYLRLAERLWSEPTMAGPFNFGPATHEAASVRDVIELARRTYGPASVSWGDGDEGPHEASVLCLETARARAALGVRARWGLDDSVARTLSWYRRFGDGVGSRELCAEDIEAFEAAACGGAIS